MDLSIIIVNYNVKYFLEQCLYSVIKASENIKAEVFVVDNHSTDGSRDYLESKFPKVIFRWEKENLGFAKANNSVLNEVKAEIILFLNPDSILPEDCFEKCLQFFRLREQCGALGVRMIDGAGMFLRESKRSFPAPMTSFYKMTGLTNMFPASKLFSKYYAGHLPEHEVGEVDVLAGAFFMVRKKVLAITGGFDEDFFMYAEDIDLSYRIQKAGFKNYYLPVTTIIHFKGESTQKETSLYLKRFYGAMQLFVKKHYRNEKLTRFLMSIAISLGMFLSFIKLSVKRIFRSNKTTTTRNRDTLIVAGQNYFNEMIQLIKYAIDPFIIQGRVSVASGDKHAAIGHVNELPSLVYKYKTGKIVFCEGKLGFKEIIESTEQLKTKVDFLFHAKGSDSIVGSNSKNENGVFIAKSEYP